MKSQPNVNPVDLIRSETRRRLSPVAFAENRTVTLDIPLDTCIKRAEIRMAGYHDVTYSSGSPVADSAGGASRICPRLDVVARGSDTIKSVDIYMLQKQQQLLVGIMGERAYTTDITGAPTTRVAQTEAASGAPFVYPATTKYLLLNESFTIYFEMPWAYGLGKVSTVFYTKNLPSAEFRFNFGALSNLQRAESSPVSITYANINIEFVVTLVENQSVIEDPANPFMYFKEIVKRVNFTAESRDSLVPLPRGNWLTGIHFLVRNGDANKSLSDIAVTNLKLLANSSKILAQTRMIELQAGNRMRYGVNAARSSGVTSLQGYAFLNLLIDGDIRTALNTANLQALDLAVDTAASSGTDAATYTNPVELSIMTQEIARKSS